jgi:hypothetical protein
MVTKFSLKRPIVPVVSFVAKPSCHSWRRVLWGRSMNQRATDDHPDQQATKFATITKFSLKRPIVPVVSFVATPS